MLVAFEKIEASKEDRGRTTEETNGLESLSRGNLAPRLITFLEKEDRKCPYIWKVESFR